MLDAAYREFAEQGFAQASTNRIVKEAGIGKGMLFYYFKSKQELFNYLVEHGLEFVMKEYLSQLDTNQPDFIERYRLAAVNKLNAYVKYPHVFNFFGNLYMNNLEGVPPELAERVNKLQAEGFAKLFTDIDTSLFRKDIPHEQILKLIQWSMDGYTNELLASLKDRNLTEVDFDPYWQDFFEFLQVLRKIYYENNH
ncbi:TetR/AcrR family transcriptional regulator [Dethiobacter alkaliphilus]|nr:TetR/AcrR family transcriptional regulator [Dethiobacter alkaliphilus]